MRTTPVRLAVVAAVAAAIGGGGTLAFAAGTDDISPASAVAAPASAGPPANFRGYEVWRANTVQPNVDVTTSGPIRQGTHVLTLHLDPGSYFVWAWVTAGKDTGNGVLRCAVLVPEGAVTFARVSMGDQPGTSRGTTLTSHGAYAVPEGGMDLELKCTQEPGATGATPQVFDAVIDALHIRSFTSTQGS
jgi:hypothetical protein